MTNINHLPSFVRNELEKLQEKTAPLVKKASKYMLWSMPLIFISFFNLTAMLFFTTGMEKSVPALILFAVLGAFGLALSKEAKHQQKEIHKLSTEYMVDRIKKSEIASEIVKTTYIQQIYNTPLGALNHFIDFLEKEKSLENRWNGQTGGKHA